MKLHAARYAFLLTGLLAIGSQQATDLTQEVINSIDSAGNAAQSGIAVITNSAKEALQKAFPPKTWAEKLKDSISAGADYLHKQTDLLSDFVTRKTPEVTSFVHKKAEWAKQNPEKAAAIGLGIVATCMFVKFLLKPSIFRLTPNATVKTELETIINALQPANIKNLEKETLSKHLGTLLLVAANAQVNEKTMQAISKLQAAVISSEATNKDLDLNYYTQCFNELNALLVQQI